MFELHMHEALERRIGQLFVLQFSIETFHVQCNLFKNLTHQPAEAPFTSQGVRDLMKLLPI